MLSWQRRLIESGQWVRKNGEIVHLRDMSDEELRLVVTIVRRKTEQYIISELLTKEGVACYSSRTLDCATVQYIRHGLLKWQEQPWVLPLARELLRRASE